MEHQLKKRKIPFSFHNHFSTGCRYQSEGNQSKADEFFQKAANECPEAWLGVACEFLTSGDVDSAIGCFIQTIKASGQDRNKLRSICYNNIGALVCKTGNADDSVKYFLAALNEWKNPDSMANLAFYYKERGRLEEAENLINKAIRLKSDNQYIFTKSLIQLLRGNLLDGFRNYESRWKNEKAELEKIAVFRKEWNGEKIQGKTLLVYAEQGAGDTIQMLRYCPMIKSMGIHLKIAVQKGLKPICESMGIFDEIIEDLQDRIASGNVPMYDSHVPTMSLPRIFGTEKTTVPSRPYIQWQLKMELPYNGRLKVGIVWAGSASHKHDRHRSTSIESWFRILDLPADFYSLQVGPRSIDVALYDAPVIDLSNRLQTFGDTASAIAAMDLVIGVDTSVIHLAGAMGHPVWLLNSFSPDWRWMLHRPDSPWYPSIRQFRQVQPGDWRWVFDEVRRELKTLCESKTTTSLQRSGTGRHILA